MDIKFVLDIYTFIGSTIAIGLALLQLLDRFPKVKIEASTSLVNLPILKTPGGAQIPLEAPAIHAAISNHGKMAIYPKRLYLLVGNEQEIVSGAYNMDVLLSQFSISPIGPDRSFEVAFYGQAVFEKLLPKLRSSRKVSVRVICLCENGRRYKSNVIFVDPASLQANLNTL